MTSASNLSYTAGPPTRGKRDLLAARNARFQELFSCNEVEFWAILAVVVAYQQTGRPVLRSTIEQMVELVHGISGGGGAATNARKRGVLRDGGRSYTSAAMFLPGPRAFTLIGIPIPITLKESF